MSEVFLHIGHGKTGSSYLQSVLNLSKEKLLENGFSYPLEEKDCLDPEKISSGNGRLIYELNLDWLDKNKKVIFSDEHLFRMMCDSRYLNKLSEQFKSLGFTKAHILLFTRDPVSHAASSYQQSIKRDGNHHSIESRFESYDIPKKVAELIRTVNSDSFFDIRVYNYSKHKKDLVGRLADWLNLDKSIFSLPKKKTINRSLTSSELYIQSSFNKHLGKCSALISDPLCELLPNVKADVILPDTKTQTEMLERIKEDINFVNKKFPNEAYRFDVTESQDSIKNKMTLSTEQLEVICNSLAKRILEQRNVIKKLKSTKSSD
ncbi:hypothetical protein Q9290_08205 [Oceanimonas sp. CHS3-5]|uniref:hypothetical protein n=1 Tax=Oceanimonas sp. CHS3-5 TaxID=3068186 RepID=UPI00273D113A|nr:hypothetical protein [Oceanimonas sp. CHS3-5]MDP5292268.1 hypothetical protein [Oceanimonas sp. CHS3-5]